MKNVQIKSLTPTEMELLHIFWDAHGPLTSVEILQLSDKCPWHGNYLYKMLHALQEKGFLEVCGIMLFGRRYARQFIPTLTKEEYAAEYIAQQGFGVESLTKIALALAKNEDKKNPTPEDHEALIHKLEKMIEDFKKQEEK